MGINISWGTQAGSEGELRGRNVDAHTPAGLQCRGARMLWFQPKPGAPGSPRPSLRSPGQVGQHQRESRRANARTSRYPPGHGKTSVPGGLGGEAAAPSPKREGAEGRRGECRSQDAAGEGLRRETGTLSPGMEMETQPGSKPARRVGVGGEGRAPREPQTPSRTKACDSGQRPGVARPARRDRARRGPGDARQPPGTE